MNNTKMNSGYSHVEVWDEAAAGYAAKPLPTFESDRFLQFLSAEGAISPTSANENPRILDIGCGAGAYSIALAKYLAKCGCSGIEAENGQETREGNAQEKAEPKAGPETDIEDNTYFVIGCDISPKMIEAACERAACELPAVDIQHVEFICGDFAELFTQDQVGSFDLVFAHFTPALSCAEDLEKMMSLVKPGGWCFTAIHARRTDALLQRLRELVGLPPKTDRLDETFLKAFSYVWLSGKTPTVVHYPNEWTSTRTLEDAKRIYGGHLVATDLTPDQRATVDAYLDRVAEADAEGLVREHCTSTVVVMGWQM